jgi:hypothetical protein
MRSGSDSPFNPTLDDCPERAGFTKELLDKIWSVYGRYDAIHLSNITQADGTPWKQVFGQYNGHIPKRTDIPPGLIRGYFVKLGRNEARP